MAKLFLSYGRDDDEPFVRRLHADLTTAGFDVWFDRVNMPSRNLAFQQEIRDAVSACDRLVLVVGPDAIRSDYVRQEWQFAYFEADKIVVPVLRQGDYPLDIDELKLVHCEDFRNDAEYAVHLRELVRLLGDPPPRLGKLIAVPSLPVHFLSRADRLVPLRDALRADLDRAVVISGAAAKVGMHGMGGIGKSVLAALLARDRQIREAFPDGVVWVGIGSLCDLRARMAEVHVALGGDGAIANEFEGKAKLRELLCDRNKAALLILDDVWRRSDVDAFDVLGPRCRQLITTRDAGLLQSLSGTHHVVELLSDAEALRLLALAAGCEVDVLPAEAREVLEECGRLPLAVALAGGMVQAGSPWTDVRDALREHELEFLEDPHAAAEQHQNLWKMIEISVRALPDDLQERLIELAVFPEDEGVPDAAVANLWQHTGKLAPRHARRRLLELKQRSLVQLARDVRTPAESVGRVSLHDVVHHYCHRVALKRFGDEGALHTRLLDAYRTRCVDGWWTGPNDGYFLTHLSEHLLAAGRGDEPADLLHELKWLEAKYRAGLVFDLGHDFRAAIQHLEDSAPLGPERGAAPGVKGEREVVCRRLRLLDEALRRDIHFVDRHREDYPQALFQCLWNYAWWYDCPDGAPHYAEGRSPGAEAGVGLHALLERWRREKAAAEPNFPWIRTLRPPSVHLGTALLAVLRGHQDGVKSVAVSSDGRRIVSGSSDRTVRVWDARSGAEIRILRGHEGEVSSVAFSPDGRRIVGGSWDNTVRVWDALSGAELLVLRGHEGVVSSVAFSPDGSRIVGGSHDRTVRLWDARSGAELRMLRGHEGEVSSVAFSPDGSRIAGGASDGTVRVWDARSGTELHVLRGHEGWVLSVAFSPDGTQIASGAYDKKVRVWDAQSGASLRILRGHKGEAESVAFSPDGSRIVSGSSDGTVRVWNARTGAELHVLLGHQHWISSVAFFPEGTRIVSGSWDRTVRVWDALSGARLRLLRGHEFKVTCLAFSPEGARIVSGAWDQTVRVWDARSGTELHVLRGHEAVVWSVAFSPDGSRIVSGAQDKTVRVWDTLSGAELNVLRGHNSGVSSVAFSPDGSQIVSGAQDKTVRVWDVQAGTERHILSGHKDAVTGVEFSADGTRIVSGSRDKTVRVWDAVSGAELHSLHGHERWVTGVAFSPDGTQIFGESSWDKTVRVWDAVSGDCLEVFAESDDASAVTAGPIRFRYRAVVRDQQTVIEPAADGRPAAWYPDPLSNIGTHPSGRIWSGYVGHNFCLLELEGLDESAEIRP